MMWPYLSVCATAATAKTFEHIKKGLWQKGELHYREHGPAIVARLTIFNLGLDVLR